MCHSKRSARLAPQPPSYTVAGGLADALESTPLSVTRPPSYRENATVLPVDEKTEVQLVTRNKSNPSCPEKDCPSKLPMAYSAHPQSRKRSCSGCSQQTSTVALSSKQALSTSIMLLNEALSSSAMHKPKTKDEAKTNILALKDVLGEVKGLRRDCHLSRQEKKALKKGVRPLEDDVRGVLGDLKREKCRMC
jgi:hypothetical protein